MDNIANYFSNLFAGQPEQTSTPNQYVAQNYPQGLEVPPTPYGFPVAQGGRRITPEEVYMRTTPPGQRYADQVNPQLIRQLIEASLGRSGSK